jgi:transmembrane sensor
MASVESIESCAADWLARLDRPDVPDGLYAAFEAWCRADSRHLEAYLRLLEVWNRLDRLKAPGAPLADSAGGAQRGAGRRSRAPRGRPRRARILLAATLAAGLLAMAVALAWWQRFGPFAPGMQRYVTSLGGFEQVRLADGSVIELNTDSEIGVRLRKAQRDIELMRGEATFEVAPDPSRPFIVVAGGTAVRTIGTIFNVQKSNAGVEVLVTKGVVAVGPPRAVVAHRGAPSPSIVDAGQMAIAREAHVRIESMDRREIARRLAWHRGMLEFDGQSLERVAAEFNRYNRRKLVIANPAVGRLRIGGYFRATDLDEFVRVLQARFGIVAKRKPGRILLR